MTKMNKTDKDYTVDRIQRIDHRTRIACECDGPNLEDHYKKAAVEGTLKLRPAGAIAKTARDKIVHQSGYRSSLDFNFSNIFKEPLSYLEAEAKHKKEQEKIQKKNDDRTAKFQKIIDRVMLGRFEKGEDAIAEAQKLAV